MKKIILLALALGSVNAFAAQYGAAGCGLGSIAIGSESGFKQVFAATTNGTSANQTFGITSGTSNCADSRNVAQVLPQFIEVNRVALSNDVSRGDGEALQHLSSVVGCKNSQALNQALKTQMSDRFSAPSVESKQISQEILNMLQNDGNLAKACANLS